MRRTSPAIHRSALLAASPIFLSRNSFQTYRRTREHGGPLAVAKERAPLIALRPTGLEFFYADVYLSPSRFFSAFGFGGFAGLAPGFGAPGFGAPGCPATG
jgi:hypothetical protein